MRSIIPLVLMLFIGSCQTGENESSNYLKELKQYRIDRNKDILKGKSPIPKENQKSFAGLNYFKGSETFKVEAKFTLLSNQQSFKMKTNTDRTPLYIPFGKLEFSVNDTVCTLLAYKNLEQTGNELFIPFTDKTNGVDSYHTGRYLDIEIPNENRIIIDFNKCYNPYCAYNKKYSCPIPPSENNLPVSIRAGERLYHH